jgi:outer membrane protein TolC
MISLVPTWGFALSLEDCLRQAEAHSAPLQQAKETQESAGFGVELSLAPFYPQLALSGSQIALGRNPATDAQVQTSPEQFNTDTYASSVIASWNLFNNFIDYKGFQSASSSSNLADSSYREARQNLDLQVIQAYFDVLKQRQLLEVGRSLLKQRQETFQEAKALYQDGSRSYSDFLSSRSQVDSQELALSSQETTLQESYLKLDSLLGLSPDQDPALEDREPRVQPAPDSEESLQTALVSRPDLSKLKEQKRQAGFSLDQAQLEDWPVFRLDAAYSRNLAAYGLPQPLWTNLGAADENGTWNLVASVNYGFFQGFSGHAKVAQARLAQASAGQALEEGRRQADLDVRLACLELKKDLRTMELNGTLTHAAHLSLTESRRRYARGAASLLELTDAESAAAEADTGKVNAAYDYQVDQARWAVAVGRNLWNEGGKP